MLQGLVCNFHAYIYANWTEFIFQYLMTNLLILYFVCTYNVSISNFISEFIQQKKKTTNNQQQKVEQIYIFRVPVCWYLDFVHGKVDSFADCTVQ